MRNCCARRICSRMAASDAAGSLASMASTIARCSNNPLSRRPSPTRPAGCSKSMANRVIFMDRGRIIEINAPEAFFSNRHERTRIFLRQVPQVIGPSKQEQRPMTIPSRDTEKIPPILRPNVF